MALLRAKPTELPPDAIRLTKDEALEYQMKLLDNWKDWKDVFFFKYGTGILGGASAGIGIYLNSYYRSKLKLFNYGKASSFVATAMIPSFVTMVFHYNLVLPDVLLRDSCAVCTEMRAAAVQSVFGCLIPSVLASLAGFSNALNYGTYRVPYLTEPRKVIETWFKLTRPIGNTLFGLFLAQAVLAASITLLESRSVDNVNYKLDYMQEDEKKQVLNSVLTMKTK